MGGVAAGIGGGLLGAIGGIAGQQRQGGETNGNMFINPQVSQNDINTMSAQAANSAMGITPNGYSAFQNQVQSGPATSGLFGANGALNNTTNAYNNLLQNPGLTDQDQTAYGQASGNIARMFGTQEQGAAQSLADRGLSNSGVAGATFSGLAGNKQEQLANLQTQIAQQREQLNNQKLQTMGNFMSQMGGLQNQAIGQAQSAQGQQQNQLMQYIGAAQGQNNQNFDQLHSTQQQGTFGAALGGAMGGLSTANSMFGRGGMFASSPSSNGGYTGPDPMTGAKSMYS